jgi:hypothetical protein
MAETRIMPIRVFSLSVGQRLLSDLHVTQEVGHHNPWKFEKTFLVCRKVREPVAPKIPSVPIPAHFFDEGNYRNGPSFTLCRSPRLSLKANRPSGNVCYKLPCPGTKGAPLAPKRLRETSRTSLKCRCRSVASARHWTPCTSGTQSVASALHLTGRRDESGRDYIRWCFADAEAAAAFASEFKSAP